MTCSYWNSKCWQILKIFQGYWGFDALVLMSFCVFIFISTRSTQDLLSVLGDAAQVYCQCLLHELWEVETENRKEKKKNLPNTQQQQKKYHQIFTEKKHIALDPEDTTSKYQLWMLSPCPQLSWLQDHLPQFGLSQSSVVMLQEWYCTSFAHTTMLTQLHNKQDQTLGLLANEINLKKTFIFFMQINPAWVDQKSMPQGLFTRKVN